MEQFNESNELQDAPILQSLKGKSAFSAPENYFENLPSRIQDKIASKNKVRFYQLKPVWIATSFLIFAFSVSIIYHDYTESKVKSTASLSTQDIIDSGYYTEFDDSMLAQNLPVETTPSNDSISIEDFIITNTDETTLINAL
jgi:hypothetical protein